MTKRLCSHISATTMGYAHTDVPFVSVSLIGPRGGHGYNGDLTPAVARQLAYDLLMAADEVESTDFTFDYRGYEIQPVKNGMLCDWIHAEEFEVYQPRDGKLLNDTTYRTLNEVKEAINNALR